MGMFRETRNNKTLILNKASKLYNASLRGDNKEFALKKFKEFIQKNKIDFQDVLLYQNLNEKFFLYFDGIKFYTKEDFLNYFKSLSLTKKFLITVRLIIKKNTKKNE